MKPKPRALILLDEHSWDDVYGPVERRRAEALTQGPLRFHTRETLCRNPSDLAEAEVLFSGWGMERCDEAFLGRAPNLRAIFYAAGSVRHFVTDALWERGIVVSSSNSVLAATVAEFTLGQILLSLKSMWRHAVEGKAARGPIRHPIAGIGGSTVGLVSAGAIARRLVALLRPFSVRILVHDPYLSGPEAARLGVEKASLNEVFEESEVVSIHTPWLPETERMIRGHHFERMRTGATFINTARGAIVAEDEMIAVLSKRRDLYALLDVTWPEPAPQDSRLYDLPNVVLTPHIAGAVDRECRRLGAMAVDECERFLLGRPLQGEIRPEALGMAA